jgi:hypothetical protein
MTSYDNGPLHETRRSLPPLQVQSLAWPLAYVAAQSLDCLYIKHVVGLNPAPLLLPLPMSLLYTSSVYQARGRPRDLLRAAHPRRAAAPACRASPAMRLR